MDLDEFIKSLNKPFHIAEESWTASVAGKLHSDEQQTYFELQFRSTNGRHRRLVLETSTNLSGNFEPVRNFIEWWLVSGSHAGGSSMAVFN